jgi:hypothetical protein
MLLQFEVVSVHNIKSDDLEEVLVTLKDGLSFFGLLIHRLSDLD